MALYAVDGEATNSETMAEKIERLESEIEDLKDDLENERRRGDEQYDRAENLEEKYSHISDDDLEILNEYSLKGLKQTQSDYEEGKLRELEEDEEEAIEIAQDLKAAYERLNLGVTSEIDNIIELTNKLIGLYL